ncbi:hypothetical protein AVEN_224098-1 [Araneus ventricosus]|uniref:Uncharacterized protein n=1 Tax=Araneus ventricosus TaxID=182803 RepID=A0A4Y2DWW8_ARAVE|nr:hypothetical protein AVEN_224098-1 [Araneus ventricosus]
MVIVIRKSRESTSLLFMFRERFDPKKSNLKYFGFDPDRNKRSPFRTEATQVLHLGQDFEILHRGKEDEDDTFLASHATNFHATQT